MKKIERPKEIKKHIKKLGLKWKIRFFVDEKAEIFSIRCLPTAKEHHIIAAASAMRNSVFNVLYEWLHELCHAKLAEAIDPQFATAFFSKRYPSKEWLVPRMKGLYYAWAHIDIWVNRLMRQIDFQLARQERADFFRAFEALIQTGSPQPLTDPQMAIGLAMSIVETEAEADVQRGQIPPPNIHSSIPPVPGLRGVLSHNRTPSSSSRSGRSTTPG